MENKKPQNTPATVKTPTKALVAKPKLSAPAKAEKPKQAPQVKENKPAPAKTVQPKPSVTQKPQSASAAKVAQPTPKKPNIEAKEKVEAVKQPSSTKPKAPITKAPVIKVAETKPITEKKVAPAPKAVPEVKPTSAAKAAPEAKPAPAAKAAPKAKPAPAPKAAPEVKPTPAAKAAPEAKPTPAPKAAPEAKPTPAPKAAPEAKPAPAAKVAPEAKPAPAAKAAPEAPEVKVDAKSSSTTIPSSKSSKLISVATKGFVIQSWQIVVAVAIVTALVIGGILLGTVLGNQNAGDPIVDYTGPLVNKTPDDPNNIALPGYPELVFVANTQKVTLELPNPSGNPCYFQYRLTIVETGEELYRSELIEPGKMIKEPTLNRALSQGTYTLRIAIDTFSLADGTTQMNGGVQEVTLTVK